MKYLKYPLLMIFTFLFFNGCEEDLLTETPKDTYSASSIKSDKKGLQRVLYGAYQQMRPSPRNYIWIMAEMTTDISIDSEGGLEKHADLYEDFTWNADHGFIDGLWGSEYTGIRNANAVLDNIDKAEMEEETRELWKAEARFIRAYCYDLLYKVFGPVPLVKTTERDDYQIPRATEDEMKSFIESELRAAAEILPETQEEFGRATKGAALGILTKYFLNTRQWQKAASVAQEVMDMDEYSLYPDYRDLFKVSTEPNRGEFIFAFSCSPIGQGNNYLAHSLPPKYPTSQKNFGTQFRTTDFVVHLFASGDQRAELIITEYSPYDSEDTIQLVGECPELPEAEHARSFKYWPDPNVNGPSAGNDIPVIRYADIILSRAEALNEINGPTQESVDLINEVRNRAEAPLLNLSDVTTKGALRDTILMERVKEFYNEGKRRMDLIRHNQFISNAQARGKQAAKEHHRRFPIPQSELDANPELEQNSGY
jgi:hypothetical protein